MTICQNKGKKFLDLDHYQNQETRVLEAMALDSRHHSTSHVLGLERRVHGLSLRGQVIDLRGKALGLDPFSHVCLVFMLQCGTHTQTVLMTICQVNPRQHAQC